MRAVMRGHAVMRAVMREQVVMAAFVVLVGCASPGSEAVDPDAGAPLITCGNGQLDDGEQCDGAHHAGLTCTSLGLGTGSLACRADCRGFDDAGCSHDSPPDGPPSCEALTCAGLGLSCGNTNDGCGHPLDCGTCGDPPSPSKWTSVGAGGEHTCAVRDDGSAWCFGRNNFAQVGAGGTPFGYDAKPVRLPTANDWRSIAVGDAHACGLRSNGKVWCWGKNDMGQLGNGLTVSTGIPVNYTEPQGQPYAEITAGAAHTCARRAGNGGLRTCAGSTAFGGFPDAVPSYAGEFYATIGSGGDASCAVDSSGVLRCDVLGNSPTSNSTRVWKSIDVGDAFWCAIAAGGSLYCQGDGIWGQLGNGANTASTTPVQVGTSLSWSKVSAGGRHACGITSDATLYCWGANESGQLGDTTSQRRSTPTYVGTGWAAVSAGRNHTCAIDLVGGLWCWGEGDYGRLGTMSTVDRTNPTQVTMP